MEQVVKIRTRRKNPRRFGREASGSIHITCRLDREKCNRIDRFLKEYDSMGLSTTDMVAWMLDAFIEKYPDDEDLKEAMDMRFRPALEAALFKSKEAA